jgi:hypothetical protein
MKTKLTCLNGADLTDRSIPVTNGTNAVNRLNGTKGVNGTNFDNSAKGIRNFAS